MNPCLCTRSGVDHAQVGVESLLDPRASGTRGKLADLWPAKRSVVTYLVVLTPDHQDLILSESRVDQDIHDSEVGVEPVYNDTGRLTISRSQTFGSTEEARDLPLGPGADKKGLRHLVAPYFVVEFLEVVVDVSPGQRGATQVSDLGTIRSRDEVLDPTHGCGDRGRAHRPEPVKGLLLDVHELLLYGVTGLVIDVTPPHPVDVGLHHPPGHLNGGLVDLGVVERHGGQAGRPIHPVVVLVHGEACNEDLIGRRPGVAGSVGIQVTGDRQVLAVDVADDPDELGLLSAEDERPHWEPVRYPSTDIQGRDAG